MCIQPLIFKLQPLWEIGVETYDISRKHNFMLWAALMWTISDFPAYSMLFGWSTSSRLVCPYCMDELDVLHCKMKGNKLSLIIIVSSFHQITCFEEINMILERIKR